MKRTIAIHLFLLGLAGILSPLAQARVDSVELTRKNAERQIRNQIEPVLEKFCKEECKLMSVSVAVDLAKHDDMAPGFEESDPTADEEVAPSGGTVKLLVNDRVGPISRGKLTDLLQQYLDTLDFPVRIDTQIAHFPQPIGSESKVAELRDKAAAQFRGTLEDLFQQFCPTKCMLADMNVDTDVVNGEEAQYGSPGEFIQSGDTAIKIKNLAATILMDDSLSQEERNNILEMAKLKTNYFKNVALSGKTMKFPKPTREDDTELAGGENANGAKRGLASTGTKSDNSSTVNNSTDSKSQANTSTQSTTTANENNTKQERFERFEKIERVENGDAVQAELQKFKVYGLIFGCSVLSLLIFIALGSFARPRRTGEGSVMKVIQGLTSDPVSTASPHNPKAILESGGSGREERNALLSKRYEIDSILEDLVAVFAQQPRVAKQVFSRVLTEEGVEVTAQYIHLFGETIVMEMLRDPSLQSDMSELMEFYAKNPVELTDEEKLELLRKLHNRTVAGKLAVMGNRSSTLFDFLAEMDAIQILELVRTESLTVKAIILTQCDSQKRAAIYSQLDQDVRMKLLTELSRIDYLPRDYIFNVANALKRKRRENPKLNTEALPGSEVLVSLLERTSHAMQQSVMKTLEVSNPESARTVKSKLVSIDTLKYLRDGQLLEVVLSLKHEELLHFLKGAAEDLRAIVFSKSPKELVLELEDELAQLAAVSREQYSAVERKVLNRMKLLANDGVINLVETNERMFSDGFPEGHQVEQATNGASIRKVAGW